MITPSLKRQYTFMKANAGYCVGHRAEGALRLAKASLLLSELEDDLVSVIWAYDEDADRGPVDWGWSAKDIKRWNESSHEVEWCSIRTAEGKVIASLSGIWDADTRYRRVVEAELALECLDALEEIASEAEASETETLS